MINVSSSLNAMPGAQVRDAQVRELRGKGTLFGQDKRVYDAIFSAIMSQRLAPGTKLTESALCEALDAPRAVVRMGLLRLAHDHIVELRPNRGAVVAQPTLEEAHAVFEARRLIEGNLVETLCGRLQKRQLTQLRKIVNLGWAAFENDERAVWISMAGEFHIVLAECSGNPVISGFVRELVTRSQLITASLLQPGRTVFRRDERLHIVDMLGDGGRAAPRHARTTILALLADVEQRLGEPHKQARPGDLREALRPS